MKNIIQKIVLIKYILINIIKNINYKIWFIEYRYFLNSHAKSESSSDFLRKIALSENAEASQKWLQ